MAVPPPADPIDPGRGWALRLKWNPFCFDGGHPCLGRLDSPCACGPAGGALPAVDAESQQCNFCDFPILQTLYGDRQDGVLTHLLLALDDPGRRAALARIEDAVGVAARSDMEARCARAWRRRDPARPRRGPHGPYHRGVD
ncbi:unnamed protein product [Symbiodinium sp. CCMP2592]|nr:unnamed protein product [Symbiodinium sp. CCMP2592]